MSARGMRAIVLASLAVPSLGYRCDAASASAGSVEDGNGRVPDLRCPGTPGCEHADGPLHAGVGEVVITPVVEALSDLDGNGVWSEGEPFVDRNGNGVWDPVWLGGFQGAGAAIGVHDETWVRALSLRRGPTRIGVLAVDAVGISYDATLRVRAASRDRGLGYDQIVVVATHTHGSQDTLGFYGPSPFETGCDPAYVDRIVAAAVQALEQAVGGERVARLRATQAPFGSRTFIGDSRLPHVVDATLTAVEIATHDAPMAVLAIYGDHPESLNRTNRLITADYVHFLRERLEQAFPGAMAMFLPGNLGGLMTPLEVVGCPDSHGNETCANGTFEKAHYIGYGIANEATRLLRGTPWSTDATLAFSRTSPLIRIHNPFVIQAYLYDVFERRVYGADGVEVSEAVAKTFSPEEIAAGALRIQSEVDVVRLGPLQFVTLPGELFPELWMANESGASLAEQPIEGDFYGAPVPPALSALLPSDLITASVNQGNDAIGYILPTSQWDVEPPFAYGGQQYGEELSLSPHLAPALQAAVERALGLFARGEGAPP
jgi:hypothetical protein